MHITSSLFIAHAIVWLGWRSARVAGCVQLLLALAPRSLLSPSHLTPATAESEPQAGLPRVSNSPDHASCLEVPSAGVAVGYGGVGEVEGGGAGLPAVNLGERSFLRNLLSGCTRTSLAYRVAPAEAFEILRGVVVQAGGPIVKATVSCDRTPAWHC